MKTNNFKTAIVALITATTGIQAVNAQQSVADNRRERILQVLDQSRPNEYVPAGFFLHFENKLGRKAVEDHKAFYKATNMDFVKVFYEIAVPKIDIQSGKDWEKVPVYSEEFFAPQVAVIEDLAREFGKEAFILPTVYSPLALAHQTLGRGKDFKKLIEEDPKAFGQAIKNLSLSIENYLRSARKHGADGFYVTQSLQRSGKSRFAHGTSTFLRLPTRLVLSISFTSATMVLLTRMQRLSMSMQIIQQASSTFL